MGDVVQIPPKPRVIYVFTCDECGESKVFLYLNEDGVDHITCADCGTEHIIRGDEE